MVELVNMKNGHSMNKSVRRPHKIIVENSIYFNSFNLRFFVSREKKKVM